MREMPIIWKRLIKDGRTCDRCGSTFRHLESATAKLDAALRPLGIQPVLSTEAIGESEFLAQPSELRKIYTDIGAFTAEYLRT